jgi:hypothetical protein
MSDPVGAAPDPTLGHRPEAAAVDPTIADLRRSYTRSSSDERV